MRGQTFCLAVLVYANSMAEQQDGPTCDKVLMGFFVSFNQFERFSLALMKRLKPGLDIG